MEIANEVHGAELAVNKLIWPCARYWLQLPSHLKDCSTHEFTSGHEMGMSIKFTLCA